MKILDKDELVLFLRRNFGVSRRCAKKMAKKIYNIRNMYFAEGIPEEEIPEDESGDLMYNILGNTNLEKVLMWNFGVSRNAAKKMVHEILKIRRIYHHNLKEEIKKEADEWSGDDENI